MKIKKHKGVIWQKKFFAYSYATIKYYAETAQDLESGSLIGIVTGSEVFAWWKPVVVAIFS